MSWLVLCSNACHMVVVRNESVNGFIRRKKKTAKAIKLWHRGGTEGERTKMENEAKHENVMKEANLWTVQSAKFSSIQ